MLSWEHGISSFSKIWRKLNKIKKHIAHLSLVCKPGTIMTIAKDYVKPSPMPDSWKLNEIFATGVVIGTYLALVTVLFYWIITETNFFEV